MSDDTMREAPAAASIPTGTQTGAAPVEPERPPVPTESSDPTGASDAGTSDTGVGAVSETGVSGPGGQPRRRRRGSRGGRNRKKPASATASSGGATPSDDDDDEGLPEDEHDEGADRGLTTEDVMADALEDAGLDGSAAPRVGGRPLTEPAPRPRIGDSRPAPVPAVTAATAPAANGDAPAKRRRRRGGRGRGRGSGGGGGAGGNGGTGGAQGAPATSTGRRSAPGDVVRADSAYDEPALALDDDVLERRRGRTRKGRPAGRYMMCVHVLEGGHTHIAVLEGRNLVEHTLATPHGNDSIDGNIYLGRVQNVLPGMEAAFVDISTPKNGVLYRGDVAFDKADIEGGGRPKIERMLKNGQTVIVQVTKNPIAHKGARLTQEVSLAGRFLVMVPGEPETYGISKRLPDDERKRLRRILDDLRPDDAGLIVRTAAEGATRDELERDVRRLRSQWEQISALAGKSKQAKLLYQEPDLVLRLIREEFTKEYRGIAIDDRALYESTRAYVEAMAPELADRVEFYDTEEEGLPIFERFHVSEQLLKALDRKVWLPSGGSLVIERTEALTVIDVNTGKNVGKSNLEETVFQNNLEAAEEVARQLRLRDIGGIIVIDFVDMEIVKNQNETMRVFRDALARDKTRTQAFEMSELGLVEMTRKRISEGLVESFSQTCPTCHGRGFVLDEELIGSMS
ncbi:MAG: Rne/Rng family ribonuclease [Acidimicrobiia bacterium]